MSAARQAGSVSHGSLSRLGIGAQVLFSAVLALCAVLLVNWLAGRPGLRLRLDLTASEQNTLSTASQGVLARLADEITIDIFFRPEEPPLTQVAFMAQERTRRLLLTLRESSAGRVELRYNDTSDARAIEQRLSELRLRGFENCLVVSAGDQREVVGLIGDLAVFDPGAPPPDPRPARIVEFNAERALVQAVLEVTRGADREVYFTVGHGEREVDDESGSGLSQLDLMLSRDGLGVSRWNPLTDGPVPEDCACLSIVGATDAFSDGALDGIEAYVRAGGRLVVAPHPEDPVLERSRVGELGERFGIEVQGGLVCQPVTDPQTGRLSVGEPSVTSFFIAPDQMANHPLVIPIRRAERSFVVAGTHPLRRTSQPRGGMTSALFTSSAESWVDAFVQGRTGWSLDYRPDTELEPVGRRFELAMASSFRVQGQGPVGALEERPEARLVVMGSSMAFTNELFRFNNDLLKNIYNWVLDREYRLQISQRNPDVRQIPVGERERVIPALSQFAWGWLPGSCLLLGALIYRSRSRTARGRGSAA